MVMYVILIVPGFMKVRSTHTNLLSIMQCIFETLDNQGQVDVIYFDMMKGFNLLHHEILLDKLNRIFVSSKLCQVYKS